jgi:hypothetical protein
MWLLDATAVVDTASPPQTALQIDPTVDPPPRTIVSAMLTSRRDQLPTNRVYRAVLLLRQSGSGFAANALTA